MPISAPKLPSTRKMRILWIVLGALLLVSTLPLWLYHRQVLRLSEAEFPEGVFCWKGFLYYKWVYRAVAEATPNVLNTMILAQGHSVRIAPMASTPFISRICRSISVMSGSVARNCLMASIPELASATIFISRSIPMSAAIPSNSKG